MTDDQLAKLEPDARAFYEHEHRRGYVADEKATAFSISLSLKRIADLLADVALLCRPK